MRVDVIELMKKYRVMNRYPQDGMVDLIGTSQPTHNRINAKFLTRFIPLSPSYSVCA